MSPHRHWVVPPRNGRRGLLWFEAALTPAALGAVFGLLAGCVSGPTADDLVARPPAMPTIRPAIESKGENEYSEVIASALKPARAGDLQGALKALGAISEPADRSRAALKVTATLAEENPSTAAALAMAMPEGPAQTNALELAARSWVKRDPEAALRWAAELRDDMPSLLARHAVTTELVGANPRSTIDRIMNLPPGAVRDDMLVTAAGAWARRDADAAIDWLHGRADDALKPRLVSSVGFAVAQTRPDRAISVADMLPEGRDRWLLYSTIAQTWIAVDQKSALAWASGMPAGAARDAVYSGFETGLGVPVLRRVARAPGTRSAMRTRGGAVAMAWPELNSPDFSAWLATQRPGMSHDEATLEYVRQRGAASPSTIGQWLTTLPSGPSRDRAMETYLDNVLPTAPSEAANWLSSMPRSDRTDEMVDRTALRWLQTNPEAAKLWLDQLNLPPDRKEELLRRAGK